MMHTTHSIYSYYDIEHMVKKAHTVREETRCHYYMSYTLISSMAFSICTNPRQA